MTTNPASRLDRMFAEIDVIKAEVALDLLVRRDAKPVVWTRVGDSTASHPDLTAVRDRGGDRCHFCGRAVNWADRRSSAQAVYHHLQTPEHLVVACRGCSVAHGLPSSVDGVAGSLGVLDDHLDSVVDRERDGAATGEPEADPGLESLGLPVDKDLRSAVEVVLEPGDAVQGDGDLVLDGEPVVVGGELEAGTCVMEDDGHLSSVEASTIRRRLWSEEDVVALIRREIDLALINVLTGLRRAEQ